MEGVSVATLIASLGSFIAVLFDKMKNSRCTTISCCGCIECDRSVLDEAACEKVSEEKPKKRTCRS